MGHVGGSQGDFMPPPCHLHADEKSYHFLEVDFLEVYSHRCHGQGLLLKLQYFVT